MGRVTVEDYAKFREVFDGREEMRKSAGALSSKVFQSVDDRLQRIPATYVEEVYLGLTTSDLVRLANGTELMVRRISESTIDARFIPGEEVTVGWRTDDARLHAD